MIRDARPLPKGEYECVVLNCARCGADHSRVRFSKFTKPAGESTHWGTCPDNGEPILFRVTMGNPAPGIPS